MENKYLCNTCKEMKHDTAFAMGFNLKLNLSKCLDCSSPNRWDEAKEFINKLPIMNYPDNINEMEIGLVSQPVCDKCGGEEDIEGLEPCIFCN